jgi:hypothetical protein
MTTELQVQPDGDTHCNGCKHILALKIAELNNIYQAEL